VRGKKEKDQGLFISHFNTTFNLEVRRKYVIIWLLSHVGWREELLNQEGEQSQTTST
jgi:hypothetical protein